MSSAPAAGARSEHRQAAYRVRLDWGPTGAQATAQGAALAVVVDILSFTTAVTVGVERGLEVLPYPWRDPSAAAYAAQHAAVLAVGRHEARRSGGVSLSPARLRTAVGVRRVVLPSPNGSAISAALAGTGATVVAASLRNRGAVARWLAPRLLGSDSLVVVAAGERWPDGSLRPAVEDLWGAGAVLAAVADLGVTGLSPEARVAEQAFRAVRLTLAEELAACAGGRELIADGFPEDVSTAARTDVTGVVPVLGEEGFRAAPRSEGGELDGGQVSQPEGVQRPRGLGAEVSGQDD
ncbi:MAG TPA: 2-phosphosulfolactate phosphatase [Nocardioides sp.]|uniref:2-phosphosulfolactate phosphatase n=1 Tax=Nocardioides sp. TaxID=35761 RepID=UPI002D167015|nr:2-phosphosulfolactate phosphatase [Nocardioides sp.]HQR26309.1 2-phosphosulfolactate phosphatase [Nocardioides sp.]